MKKEELKKILKPLIKECIKEVLFEPGVLSNVIQEVVRGLDTSVIRESAEVKVKDMKMGLGKREKQQRFDEEIQKQKQKVNSTRKQLLDSIGASSYNGVNLFEGTNPINKGGKVGDGSGPQDPLAQYAPDDPGVDISALGFFKKD